jgi:hypothetical protein
MSMHPELFYQEYLSPLYKKYLNDPEFLCENEDGMKICNLQHALLKESQDSSTFVPVLSEQEDGRELIIGFVVPGLPMLLLYDTRYAQTKVQKDKLFINFYRSVKQFCPDITQLQFLSFTGFSDLCLPVKN